MCDTFVHYPSSSNQSVFFGKNSDREPNEAQYIVHIPAENRENDKVKTTFIEVDHPQEVCSVILCQPFQMWGAEMGINEHGVVIGNEAVFTKIKFNKKNIGLTGMDLLRLSLEISKTSKEALENIISYLSKYGQDACGGYTDKQFYYHNSFMIADKNEAYVLETAGKFWAYKRILFGYRAISNGLSIDSDYDGLHPEAESFAREKAWLDKREKFNFKKAFSAFWMPKLAACEARRSLSEAKGKSYNDFSVREAFEILRSHAGADETFTPDKGNTSSLCMHASGLFTPHQSVGSMVVELRRDGPPTIWLTGTSAPCLSLFKPFYLHSPVLTSDRMMKPKAVVNDALWWQWEMLHRKALRDYPNMRQKMATFQSDLERNWVEADKQLVANNQVSEKGHSLSEIALQESMQILDKMLLELDKSKTPSSFLYSRFWKNLNKLAALKID